MGRETNRQTERKIDKQPDKHTHRHTHRQKVEECKEGSRTEITKNILRVKETKKK